MCGRCVPITILETRVSLNLSRYPPRMPYSRNALHAGVVAPHFVKPMFVLAHCVNQVLHRYAALRGPYVRSEL